MHPVGGMSRLTARGGKLSLVGALVLLVDARSAVADPLRLRADALVQSQSPAPVGLVVLQGEDQVKPWIDAEAVTWVGASRDPNVVGDVLSLSVRLRDLKSGSEARFGRMLVTSGAVRPLQLDGVRAIGRAPWGTSLEAFGGFPVVRGFDYRAVEIAGGGRVAQAFGDTAIVGAAYLHRRRDGNLFDEEAGADATFMPARWLSAAGRWSWDVTSSGTSEALASVSAHAGDARAELFATYRSPSRILPATSLFSVLGNVPATTVGGTGRYRMFPRLELVAGGGAQTQSDVFGGNGFARATLALDDTFDGIVGLESRRTSFGESRWTGVRFVGSKPLPKGFRISTELELVVPDRPKGRGAVWPWMLGAIGYRPAPAWDLAVAVEAASGPENRAEANVLLRASHNFGVALR